MAETNLQADVLRLDGCDELQGYFFGRPLPIGHTLALLAGDLQPTGSQEEPEAAPPKTARASEHPSDGISRMR